MFPALIWLLVIFTLLASIATAFAFARGWRNRALWAISLAALGLAVIDPPLPWGGRPVVAVLVDLSPSTRGFWFRDAEAVRAIESTLSSRADVHVFGFADGAARPLSHTTPFVEIPARETTLPAIDADAAVLLTDGQLTTQPARIPIFPIVDASQPAPVDAQIESASLQHRLMTTRVRSNDVPRELIWPGGEHERVEPGLDTLRHVLIDFSTTLVHLTPHDLWPENDSLEAAASQTPLRLLWIGTEPADGFEAASASSIDLQTLAHTGAVVLNDVPIDSLPASAQADVARYVRDFGGSLTIGGGSDSLSAGGYGNTTLDALSPLASLPSAPTHDLFILLDTSGSMASATQSGRTRLEVAADAARAIDRVIPDSWSVRAGGIARELRWWPIDKTRVAPPIDLIATGPTNLGAGIRAVAGAESTHRKRLILISDGQADAASIAALAHDLSLAPELAQKPIVIDWLALPPADPNGELAQLVRATGGLILPAGSADQWRARAEQLGRGAISSPLIPGPFSISLPDDGPISVDRINAVSLREGATATASVEVDRSNRPVAATWNVGLGKVTTLAFHTPSDLLAKVARATARLARDPRFGVRADADSVEVTARDSAGPMNALAFSLVLDDQSLPLPQIAPGRYRLDLTRSDQTRFASVRLSGQSIESFAIPGRYAREFETIGLDRARLETLASSSGGKVLDRSQFNQLPSLLPSKPGYRLRTPALLLALASMSGLLVFARLRVTSRTH